MSQEDATALRVPGRHLCGLAWLDGLLWYSDGGRDEIIAVAPETGEVVHSRRCRGVRTGLTAADGGRALMQVVGADKRLRKIDPRTGETLAEYANPRPGGELCGVHETEDGLWTGYSEPAVIELRDLSHPEPCVSFAVAEDVADLTVVGDLIVFANHRDGWLNVIDPWGGQFLTVIPVLGGPTGLTWDGRRLWYCDHASSHLRAVETSFFAVGATA